MNDEVYTLHSQKKGSSNTKSAHYLPKQTSKNQSVKRADTISDIYTKFVNLADIDDINSPRRVLENLFRIICIGDGPEIYHIKHCNLNRNNLKLFLSKRYPPKLAERLTQGFFVSTPSSYQMGYHKFIEHFSNFLKSPIHLIQLFCFKCYDISGKGNICEHDVFQIFQNCKEYIPIQSYITLLEDEKLYNEFDSMIKDTKSDLFSNVFVPDISKISDLIYKKKVEFFEVKSSSSKDEEGYLGLKGYLELDKNTIMGQAFKRYKMSGDICKPACDFTINVFDHKNIFTSTAAKLPPCVTLNEDDFLSLDFDYGIPHLYNDVVKYLTNGLIDPHEHYK